MNSETNCPVHGPSHQRGLVIHPFNPYNNPKWGTERKQDDDAQYDHALEQIGEKLAQIKVKWNQHAHVNQQSPRGHVDHRSIRDPDYNGGRLHLNSYQSEPPNYGEGYTEYDNVDGHHDGEYNEEYGAYKEEEMSQLSAASRIPTTVKHVKFVNPTGETPQWSKMMPPLSPAFGLIASMDNKGGKSESGGTLVKSHLAKPHHSLRVDTSLPIHPADDTFGDGTHGILRGSWNNPPMVPTPRRLFSHENGDTPSYHLYDEYPDMHEDGVHAPSKKIADSKSAAKREWIGNNMESGSEYSEHGYYDGYSAIPIKTVKHYKKRYRDPRSEYDDYGEYSDEQEHGKHAPSKKVKHSKKGNGGGSNKKHMKSGAGYDDYDEYSDEHEHGKHAPSKKVKHSQKHREDKPTRRISGSGTVDETVLEQMIQHLSASASSSMSLMQTLIDVKSRSRSLIQSQSVSQPGELESSSSFTEGGSDSNDNIAMGFLLDNVNDDSDVSIYSFELEDHPFGIWLDPKEDGQGAKARMDQYLFTSTGKKMIIKGSTLYKVNGKNASKRTFDDVLKILDEADLPARFQFKHKK